MDRASRERVVWAAWRVADDGAIETVLTVEGEVGLERRRRDFATLEAAARVLGESFRKVVEKVLADGGRQGRWRP